VCVHACVRDNGGRGAQNLMFWKKSNLDGKNYELIDLFDFVLYTLKQVDFDC
jgi:hypothetical protein